MTDQELKRRIAHRLSEEAAGRAVLGDTGELTDTERLADMERIGQEILRGEAERIVQVAFPGLLVSGYAREDDGLDDMDADDLDNLWEDGPMAEEDQE